MVFLQLVSRFLGKFSTLYWIAAYSVFRARYRLDRAFRFNGKSILLYGDGIIEAGAGSYVGELSTLQAAKGYAIRIGVGCAISHNVRVYTQSAVPDADFSLGEPPQKYGDVVFGDYCWVGANVFVNPGVVIGANAVVGANSVVTKDIPPFEIWGGVPAKLIRKKRIA
jgi:maltose O-acetyltransferase